MSYISFSGRGRGKEHVGFSKRMLILCISSMGFNSDVSKSIITLTPRKCLLSVREGFDVRQ